MAYNPEEGNLSFTDEELQKEAESVHFNAIVPEERRKIKTDFLNLIVRGFSPSGAVQKMNGMTGYNAGPQGRVSYATIYRWKKDDPQFATDWKTAYFLACDLLEDDVLDWIREQKNISAALKFLATRNRRRYAGDSDEEQAKPAINLNVNITSVDPAEAARHYQRLISG